MTPTVEMHEPASGLLSGRLFDFAGRIREIDPQLTRVLVPWMMRHRRYVPGFLRLARTLKQSGRVRARQQAAGVRVPPFLILSVTSRCNLRCSGCYAAAVGTVTSTPARPGLGLEEWRRVVAEAAGLGVMAFIVAGGEPFLLPGIVDLFREFPDRLFLVFTNGTALKPEDLEALKKLSNIVVVVSLEGDRALDFLINHELPQALGEVHHALFPADPDGVAELAVLLVENQLPDRGIVPHDLEGRNPRRPLGGQFFRRRQKLLGNDRFEVEPQRLPQR